MPRNEMVSSYKDDKKKQLEDMQYIAHKVLSEIASIQGFVNTRKDRNQTLTEALEVVEPRRQECHEMMTKLLLRLAQFDLEGLL